MIGDKSMMDRLNSEQGIEFRQKTFPDDSIDAFTRPEERWLDGHCPLTKREYFAAVAMQGLAPNVGARRQQEVAEAAVMFADALIKELNK